MQADIEIVICKCNKLNKYICRYFRLKYIISFIANTQKANKIFQSLIQYFVSNYLWQIDVYKQDNA